MSKQGYKVYVEVVRPLWLRHTERNINTEIWFHDFIKMHIVPFHRM